MKKNILFRDMCLKERCKIYQFLADILEKKMELKSYNVAIFYIKNLKSKKLDQSIKQLLENQTKNLEKKNTF